MSTARAREKDAHAARLVLARLERQADQLGHDSVAALRAARAGRGGGRASASLTSQTLLPPQRQHPLARLQLGALEGEHAIGLVERSQRRPRRLRVEAVVVVGHERLRPAREVVSAARRGRRESVTRRRTGRPRTRLSDGVRVHVAGAVAWRVLRVPHSRGSSLRRAVAVVPPLLSCLVCKPYKKKKKGPVGKPLAKGCYLCNGKLVIHESKHWDKNRFDTFPWCRTLDYGAGRVFCTAQYSQLTVSVAGDKTSALLQHDQVYSFRRSKRRAALLLRALGWLTHWQDPAVVPWQPLQRRGSVTGVAVRRSCSTG